MKLKLSKAFSLSLYALVMILIGGMVIGSLFAKEAKKERKRAGDRLGEGQGLAMRLELDEKTTEEFTKIHKKVYDEKFDKKMKACSEKMRKEKRGSEDGKKAMNEMESAKKGYDTKFQKEVEKAKILTEEQTEKLKEIMNEKKGPRGPGGPKGKSQGPGSDEDRKETEPVLELD